MNIHAYRPLPSCWLPAVMLAALVAIVINGFGLNRATPLAGPTAAGSNAVIHWHDASHDWLLVGNGTTDQLSIYDAVDGSLVRRVSVKQGLQDTNALAQRDGRLFLVGNDGELGELNLPPLQRVAANTR